MAKSNNFKRVVVKEDAKTSMRAAKIHPLRLADGQRIVALGHLYWPYHDRNLFETIVQYLQDQKAEALAKGEKPPVVLLQGGIVAEDAFKSLWDQEDNYLHDHPEAPEVLEARDAGGFEHRVLSLAESAHKNLFLRIQEAAGGLVIWTPSWTHLSMGNENRITEWIHFTKRHLNGWQLNHPESPDVVSDPSVNLPKELDQLFGLAGLPHFKVLRHGAGVMVNNDVLFMIGAFKRRLPGDASYIEWEQRGVSIVRSFDGKVASWWMTRPNHTLPGLRLKFFQGHELGYLWDPLHMAHYGDYDRRAPGFWQGRIRFGKVFGRSIPIIRGNDGRRSFVVDDAVYTEESPGCTHCGEEIFLPSEHAVLGTRAGMSSRPEIPTVFVEREDTTVIVPLRKAIVVSQKPVKKKTAPAKAKRTTSKLAAVKGKKGSGSKRK